MKNILAELRGRGGAGFATYFSKYGDFARVNAHYPRRRVHPDLSNDNQSINASFSLFRKRERKET